MQRPRAAVCGSAPGSVSASQIAGPGSSSAFSTLQQMASSWFPTPPSSSSDNVYHMFILSQKRRSVGKTSRFTKVENKKPDSNLLYFIIIDIQTHASWYRKRQTQLIIPTILLYYKIAMLLFLLGIENNVYLDPTTTNHHPT